MSKIKFIKKNQDESGITLVALVVTIIILLILAGITLNGALSANGLFIRAKQAAEKYKNAEEIEEEQLREIEKQLDNKNSINSVIKVKGVDFDSNESIGNWKFSICKDKECLQPLGIDIKVGDSGEADCSSLIKEAGTYYVGVTEPPEYKDLPFELFEFNVADIEEEQDLVIKFKGESLSGTGPYQGTFNGSDSPAENTEFDKNVSLQISFGDYVEINQYNYSSNGKKFYPIDDSYSLAQELKNSNFEIDFYKIAEWDSGKSEVVLDNNFKDLNNVDTSDLDTGSTIDPILTTRIKNIIIKNKLKPTVSYQYSGENMLQLENDTQLKKKDFYLIVPHASNSEFGKAYTKYYEVDFIPAIISFVYANENGDSLYDVSLEIDAVNANNIFSDIKIVNNITNTPEGSFKTQDFIYEITAELNGEHMYDDIIATECENEGENTYSADNLPVGLEYRIFPLYYGNQCYLTSADEVTSVVMNEEENNVEFNFEYSNNGNKDISILEYEVKYNDYYEQWEIESQNRNLINDKINIIDNGDDSEKNSLKSIEIKNTDSTDKYIRFKILSSLNLVYYCSEEDKWVNSDEFWYYSSQVSSNGTTGNLPFDISLSDYDGQPCTYNIVIIVESTNADDEGNANWE